MLIGQNPRPCMSVQLEDSVEQWFGLSLSLLWWAWAFLGATLDQLPTSRIHAQYGAHRSLGCSVGQISNPIGP